MESVDKIRFTLTATNKQTVLMFCDDANMIQSELHVRNLVEVLFNQRSVNVHLHRVDIKKNA